MAFGFGEIAKSISGAAGKVGDYMRSADATGVTTADRLYAIGDLIGGGENSPQLLDMARKRYRDQEALQAQRELADKLSALFDMTGGGAIHENPQDTGSARGVLPGGGIPGFGFGSPASARGAFPGADDAGPPQSAGPISQYRGVGHSSGEASMSSSRRIGPGPQSQRPGAGRSPQSPQLAQLLPLLLQAQARGADTGGALDMIQAMQPKRGIDKGIPYEITPDGEVKWGEGRPETRADQLAAARQEEIERRNAATEAVQMLLARSLIGRREAQTANDQSRTGIMDARATSATGSTALPPTYRRGER